MKKNAHFDSFDRINSNSQSEKLDGDGDTETLSAQEEDEEGAKTKLEEGASKKSLYFGKLGFLFFFPFFLDWFEFC